MKAMKKYLLLAWAIVAGMSLNAQEPQYTQKLDSVVGSDDFDWTRWKKVFDYDLDEAVIQDFTYRWENDNWILSEETVYQYASSDFQQLLGVIVMHVNDTVLDRASYTSYEYDDMNRLTLVMNYLSGDTVWMENSKSEYIYNVDGLLDTCLYSTIRNGEWRESSRTVYTYNDEQQCTSLLSQRKGGGWGPFGNSWMDSYRYEFEYEDGLLTTENYYVVMGWFGGEMSLDTKLDYEYDANGNLLRKTGSVSNEVDWIVRDVYENQFDPTVDASQVQGLQPFWQSVANEGMGFAMGGSMPLKNQWLSCSIISTQRDTEFTLYCSGFAGVEEEQVIPLKAWSYGGRLIVVCDQPDDITVFDLLGRTVASRRQTQQCEFDLNPGLYIVGNGKAHLKVIVK